MGWDHPAWAGVFYPDDLPEAWRLSYFANEFSGVVVPQTLWQQADRDQLRDWMDDVGDRFRFYLMLSSRVAGETCRQRARVLGGSLGGYIVSAKLHQPDLEGLTLLRMRDRQAMAGETGRMAVGMTADELGDLRTQRGILEAMASQVAPAAEVLLIVEGSPPAGSTKNLHQLAQLMGLA